MKTPFADMIDQMPADTTRDVIAAAVRAVEIASSDRRQGQRSMSARGTRLPHDWQPSEQCITYALDRGMPLDRVMIEAEKFRNYWTAKSGQLATKLKWEATWHNWILKAVERGNGTTSNNNQSKRAGDHPAARSAKTGADAILAGMGRVAARIVESRNAAGSGDRKVSADTDTPRQLDFGRERT